MSLWLNDLNNLATEPPESVKGWLQANGSITNQAKMVCHQVSLKLLDERWEEIQGQSTFVRQILILCNDKPAWYAQTLIPKKTYDLRKNQFEQLKTRPISTILFSDPQITRENFIYACLTTKNPEYHQAIQYDQSKPLPSSLWARKSVFKIEGEPLSIMEIFYPDTLPGLPSMEDVPKK